MTTLKPRDYVRRSPVGRLSELLARLRQLATLKWASLFARVLDSSLDELSAHVSLCNVRCACVSVQLPPRKLLSARCLARACLDAGNSAPAS